MHFTVSNQVTNCKKYIHYIHMYIQKGFNYMKKSRKSKIVLFSVLGLATISLATVGFASWVISGITATDSQNINVSAGDVVDNTLAATITASDLGVKFDNKVVEGGLDGNKEEDLIFTFTVKVTGQTTKIGGLEFKFTLGNGFKGLITGKYIQFITNSTIGDTISFTYTNGTGLPSGTSFTDTTSSKIEYTADGTGTFGTFACTFAFKWGDKFGGENPSSAYAKAVNKQTVIENLKAFDAAVKAISASETWLSVVVTPVLA